MDIKGIQSQALTSMNSQNIEIQRVREPHVSTENKIQQQNQGEQNKKISPNELKKAVDELNKKFEMLNSQLQLKIDVDKDTGITVLKLIDKETNKVVRQIPPETILKIAKYLTELTGLLFNERV